MVTGRQTAPSASRFGSHCALLDRKPCTNSNTAPRPGCSVQYNRSPLKRAPSSADFCTEQREPRTHRSELVIRLPRSAEPGAELDEHLVDRASPRVEHVRELVAQRA